ncbi:MAG: hypothetical protein B6226_04945 [Candidatus Cloacimonetes bacterium 4572_65]|nr:MAG: hypothetical protein B6226_04945 [Candidatus Cloacimonetes bacterium 4572_65]
MKIKFRDVSQGVVLARAIVELGEGVYINEIAILKSDDDIKIELPTKSFKGKDGRAHYMNILMFESETKKTLFEIQIKEEYRNWRADCKKVLVYES